MFLTDPYVQVGSFLGLAALVCWLVLSGRLVPRSQLRDLREDRDHAVSRAEAETTRWRAAYEQMERARRIDAAHTGLLLTTTAQVANALPAAAQPVEGDPGAFPVAKG